ncbi:MAG: hypothetical protein Q9157_001405 [Trypethelium eluteriae]
MGDSASLDPVGSQLREVGSLLTGENGKAARYLKELEQARSQCRWKDIPELARKVQKHAPNRPCKALLFVELSHINEVHHAVLVLAERSEVQVIDFLRQRSITALTSTPTSGISNLILPLRDALNDHGACSFDKLRATIILGWIHWILNEPESALDRLSTIDLAAISEDGLKNQDVGDSKHSTVIQGYLLKGTTQESTGRSNEAIGTYIASLPYLSSIISLSTTSKGAYVLDPQLHRWAEQIFSRLCGLLSQRMQHLPVDEQGKALEAFRLWAKFCHYQPKAGLVDVTETGIVSGVKRRDVWKAYYDSLSIVLTHNAQSSQIASSFSVGPADAEKTVVTARRAQRAELKRIETCYESLLLEETTFPKAIQRNDEVERWVEAVIANWRIFCGPTWQDEELGEGGKAAVSRDVLEAFNSYIDLVDKGQARAEKSGERQPDLDDDDTVLLTAAEAVRLLCQYGSRAEVEKALDVSQKMEQWLSKNSVSPQAARVAYRAMGVGRAHWARVTFENTSRSAIQGEGIQYLKKAMQSTLSTEEDSRTAFSLGLLLAETRDLSGAIDLIKSVIADSNGNETDTTTGPIESEQPSYENERRLCSLWHLLALLLSSKSDFAAAERLCDAAFDQFGDYADLFGQVESQDQARSNGEVIEKDMAYKDSPQTPRGVVDRMEVSEKEGIVQIKITQLALLEVMEGPTAAIEVSHELLGLFRRLFGDPTQPNLLTQSQGLEPMPKTSSSTVKSFGGSILGRPKTSRRKLERHPTTTDKAKTASLASRPSTAEAQVISPPLIKVIGEDGERSEGTPSHRHSHLPFRRSPHAEETPQQADSSRPKSYPAWKQGSDNQDTQKVGMLANPSPEKGTSVLPQTSSGEEVQDRSKTVGRPDQLLPSIPHNMPPTMVPPPAGHSDQPPRQDTRLPSAVPGRPQQMPEPRFAVLQACRQKTSLLVKVWLFIAGLYTRAALLEDAKGAIDEAQKLVEGLEMQVSQESSSSKAFAERGWGLGQSVDELWANVYAERGAVAEAQAAPHEALTYYDQSLAHFTDHPAAIVGLSGVLLDIYSQKIPAEPPEGTFSSTANTLRPASARKSADGQDGGDESPHPTQDGDSPEVLNRVAARDRAYHLLSTLTKLGTGWDDSEAWYMLARAYEESGQIDKAKEVLWWCVELEDGRPLRHWRCVGTGSFVL